jgi:glycosyltransferase involved in cell wall biosynthesis
MRIAFLTHSNPYDERAWSGILVHMIASLERNCGEVISLGPAGRTLYFAGRVIRRGILLPMGKNVDYTHVVLLSKTLARIFRRRLANHAFDVIFAPVARTEFAFLETDIPIIYYTDLTARQFRDYARNLRGLTDWAVQQTEELERRAYAKAKHVVVASEWAARSAMQDYHVSEDALSVVPMGANLDQVPALDQIAARRANGPSKACRLLLIGVDWERKGGSIALDAMCKLRERGIDAELTVVGCSPPRSSFHPKMHVIRFLDKSVPSERRRLNQLLLDSDFMVFPTQREAYGIVCCEANAFGLPVIASNGGGVPVWNGENGILLPADAAGEAYADEIQAMIENPDRYRALAFGGRRTFEERLNWDAWARSMSEIFQQAIWGRSSQRTAECCALSKEHG